MKSVLCAAVSVPVLSATAPEPSSPNRPDGRKSLVHSGLKLTMKSKGIILQLDSALSQSRRRRLSLCRDTRLGRLNSAHAIQIHRNSHRSSVRVLRTPVSTRPTYITNKETHDAQVWNRYRDGGPARHRNHFGSRCHHVNRLSQVHGQWIPNRRSQPAPRHR